MTWETRDVHLISRKPGTGNPGRTPHFPVLGRLDRSFRSCLSRRSESIRRRWFLPRAAGWARDEAPMGLRLQGARKFCRAQWSARPGWLPDGAQVGSRLTLAQEFSPRVRRATSAITTRATRGVGMPSPSTERVDRTPAVCFHR